MGKVKNFKVELPSEFIKDKNWRDENVKPGDVEEYRRLKAEIESVPGEIQFPVEFCSMLHKIQVNQKRLEEKMNLLIGVLKNRLQDNDNRNILSVKGSNDGEEYASDMDLGTNNGSSRLKWGDTEEEQRLTLFQILEEAEKNGIALRTTEFKKLGGKYSTVVSYSYRIFGSWKEAIRNYREHYRGEE